MGGFALALGGAGQAAGQYTAQMRQILEQRKGLLSNVWAQQAASEENPDRRQKLLQLSSDVLVKPIGGVIQDYSKTLAGQIKDNQALQNGVSTIAQHVSQHLGQAQVPLPPPPGAIPVGSTAGTGGNALPNVAQPSSNPLTQPANGGQIQTPQSLGAPDVTPVPDVTKLPPPPPDITAQPLAPVTVPGALTPPPEPTPSAVPPLLNAPVTTQPLAASSAPLSVPGLPTPETQEQIDAYFNSIPAWHTPHGQERLQGAYNARLAHAEALRNTLEAQQATMAYRREGIRQMQTSGDWEKLPAQVKEQWQGEAYGLAAPPMSASLYEPRLLSSGTLGKDAPPGTVEYGTNTPVRGGVRYNVRQIPITGQTIWQPETDLTGVAQTANGPEIINRVNGVAIAPIQNAVPNSAVAEHLITLPNGQTAFVSEAGAATGNVPPVTTGGINPSFVPTTSTSMQPGAPPITTTRTKGGGVKLPPPGTPAPALGSSAIAPVVPLASSGGGTRPVGAPPAFNDPLAKANYENYIAGKGPAPTGRQLQGVQLYAASHGLPMPDVLSGGGQKTIATLDPVLQQINDLLPRLNDIKGKSLILDYQKYKNGFATPYDDLFTGIAFERLRSGSAALQGIGSRSFPVFNEGLKHTPTFDRLHGFNPDSVNLMIDKLTEAKKIIQEERASAVADQKKSGVISSVDTSANNGLTAPIVGDPDNLRQFVPAAR